MRTLSISFPLIRLTTKCHNYPKTMSYTTPRVLFAIIQEPCEKELADQVSESESWNGKGKARITRNRRRESSSERDERLKEERN